MTWSGLGMHGVDVSVSAAFSLWVAIGVFMQGRADRQTYWTNRPGPWTFIERVLVEPAAVLGLAYLSVNVEAFFV